MHIILVLIILWGLISVVGLALATAVAHVCSLFDKFTRQLRWR